MSNDNEYQVLLPDTTDARPSGHITYAVLSDTDVLNLYVWLPKPFDKDHSSRLSVSLVYGYITSGVPDPDPLVSKAIEYPLAAHIAGINL